MHLHECLNKECKFFQKVKKKTKINLKIYDTCLLLKNEEKLKRHF